MKPTWIAEREGSENNRLITMQESVWPVVVISWLYNLHAYRRIFPPAYGTSARTIRGLFRSMPLWGQFLNHRGEVKPAMSRSFLTAIDGRALLAEIDACFPFQASTARAPVELFYRFYGV